MSGLVVLLGARRLFTVNLASHRPRKHYDEGGGHPKTRAAGGRPPDETMKMDARHDDNPGGIVAPGGAIAASRHAIGREDLRRSRVCQSR
jgi:hypothetical protein